MKKGLFIVIDGIDGSGKKTQTKLLIERLKANGERVETIDFPHYDTNFFGKFIGECLAGKHGDFAKLDPKIASVLYAADRFESSQKIKGWLEEGKIVVADRYVSSNQIHQGGKINNQEEKEEFLKWLEKMEFEIFEIPKPDVIVYLNLELQLSLDLLKNKDAQDRKKYLEGEKDAHEGDLNHMINAKRSAVELVKKQNNWLEIRCSQNGSLLSRERISALIWKELKDLI